MNRLGVLVLAVALAFHVEALDHLRRMERGGPWWLGYGRDGANLAAAILLGAGYLLVGFSQPVALLAAALTVLMSYLLDWVILRELRPRLGRLLMALPLLAWLVVVATEPGLVNRLLETAIFAASPTP